MDRSTAPGSLDEVRALLNTWHVPHDQRVPTDDLAHRAAHPAAWRAAMPGIPVPSEAEVTELTALRDALRGCLGERAPTALAGWLESHPVTVAIGDDEDPIVHRPSGPGAVASVVALVVSAVARGQWCRLKACPDCRHVFYDQSRNRSRTWCGMYAGEPDGRACGSIAKVRAYRERRGATTR